MKTRPPLLVLLGLLGGCNLAPHYDRPSSPAPAAFKEAPPTTPETQAAWERAQPRDASDRAKWWLIYQDETLNQLEDQVQASNQTLKADEAAFREARALVVEARAALFPTVTTSPSYTTFRSSRNVSGGVSSGGTTTASGGSTTTTTTSTTSGGGSSGGGTGQLFSFPVEATWEPDLWGKIRNTVASNAYAAQASAADLANARLSLQAQLAQDYFQLRATDEEQRIQDDTVAAYRRDLDAALSLYRNGVDSDEDVAQAQSQLDTAVAAGADIGASRAQFEHAIAVLVGKAPSQLSIPVIKFKAWAPPVPVVVPSQLLERRPDIAGAERRVASANAQIGVARAAYYPDLTLSATGGFEASHLAQWFAWPSRFWSLGPTVSETLLDFGMRRGENEEAWAAYDQAVANYRQTVLTAFQAVEDNLALLRILATEVQLRQTAAKSSAHYLDLSQTRFKAGIDSFLNVSAAETADLTNQNGLVQTQLRLVMASVTLVTAAGGGWEDSDLPSPGHLVLVPAK
jgi:NodT family efflux transporter outer membrane factor (OMF) lipoprotein